MYNGFYDIHEFLYKVSVQCNELLLRCVLFGKTVNCTEYFKHRITYMGACCLYNYQRPNVKDMSALYQNKLRYPEMKPLYYSDCGHSHSLSVVIKDDLDDFTYKIHSSILLKVMIFPSREFPDLSNGEVSEILVIPNREVYINVVPTIVSSDTGMRNFPPSTRRCFFQDEGNLNIKGYYSMSECLLNCRINEFLSSCGCLPPNLSNIGNAPYCLLSDIPCLRRLRTKWETQDSFNLNDNDDNIKNFVRCPDCLSKCSYIRYKTPNSFLKINTPPYGNVYKYGILENITHQEILSIVHIFFRECSFRQMQQRVTQNWDDLLGNLGGICGFMFGGSIISIIELIYLITGRYFVIFIQKIKNKKKFKKSEEELFKHELYWNEFIKKHHYKM